MAIMENIQNSQVVRAYRQGWLAWLGAHKVAFDFAQDGVEKLMANREKLVADLVEEGENAEKMTQDNINKVREYVEPRINDVTETITTARAKVFTRTKVETADRVAELSDEVAKLSKTVSSLSRKVSAAQKAKAPAKKAAPKTVAKKVAPKAAAPKAEAPKTETAPKAA